MTETSSNTSKRLCSKSLREEVNNMDNQSFVVEVVDDELITSGV